MVAPRSFKHTGRYSRTRAGGRSYVGLGRAIVDWLYTWPTRHVVAGSLKVSALLADHGRGRACGSMVAHRGNGAMDWPGSIYRSDGEAGLVYWTTDALGLCCAVFAPSGRGIVDLDSEAALDLVAGRIPYFVLRRLFVYLAERCHRPLCWEYVPIMSLLF